MAERSGDSRHDLFLSLLDRDGLGRCGADAERVGRRPPGRDVEACEVEENRAVADHDRHGRFTFISHVKSSSVTSREDAGAQCHSQGKNPAHESGWCRLLRSGPLGGHIPPSLLHVRVPRTAEG